MLTEKQLEAFYDSLSEEDKLGQLLQLSSSYFGQDGMITGEATGWKFTEEDVYHVGSLICNCNTAVEDLRAIQEEHMRHSKVPLLFMADVISGYTVALPTPLALACSFDPDLVKRTARSTADSATAYGLNVTFSPMVDISRDARWGRSYESYGEDVTLACRMAKAMVEGYQGDNTADTDSLSACVKHFAAYGYAEGGRDYNNVELSERTLRETFLPAYKAAVDAGCDMIMSSFNTIGGIPTNLDTRLLRGILRDEWGFDGVNITDWCSLLQCKNHRAVNNEKELARVGLEAAIDICMMDYIYTVNVPQMLKDGTLDPALFKDAVMRVLRLKNKKGLLEDPYRFLQGRPVDADKKWELATEAVEKTTLLLKNDGILPLSADKKVALIGPYAVKPRAVGTWNKKSRTADRCILPGEALGKLLKTPVVTAEGCGMLEKDSFLLSDEEKAADVFAAPERYIAEALAAAKAADVVVMMLGEHMQQSGESASRAEISIPAPQMELLRRVHAVNDNIVLVLFSGRALDVREADDLSRAIVFGFMPADAGSIGLANLLTGKTNFSAKLAMSFPYHAGQCPVHYDMYPTGHPSKGPQQGFSSRYIDLPNSPKYRFGYGLSYTTFTYSEVTASAETMTAEKPLTVSVTVENTGDFDGEEVVQLYIRDETAYRVSRPVRELKDFKRIALKKGEKQTVSFTVGEEMLRFYTYEGNFESEAGKFTAFVGGDSATLNGVSFILE